MATSDIFMFLVLSIIANGVSSASNIATTASANTTGSVDALDVTVPPPVKKKFKTGRKEKVVLF